MKGCEASAFGYFAAIGTAKRSVEALMEQSDCPARPLSALWWRLRPSILYEQICFISIWVGWNPPTFSAMVHGSTSPPMNGAADRVGKGTSLATGDCWLFSCSA